MNTRQHNSIPVERTIGAAGLSGLFGLQKRADRAITDQSLVLSAEPGTPNPHSDRCWLETGLAGVGTGLIGFTADQPGQAYSR